MVLVSAGPVAIDLGLMDALLYAGYGGQEAGHGLADVLFGKVSPSARLPLTFYAEGYLQKVGPLLDYATTSGVGRTYRYLNVSESPPLFSFGFGLSYSRFKYSGLRIHLHSASISSSGGGSSGGRAGAGAALVTVSCTVTNVGKRLASEIAQLYVSVPRANGSSLPVPRLALQGFEKLRDMKSGEARSIQYALFPTQVCTVLESGECQLRRGSYTVSVGGHQPGDTKANSANVEGNFTL